MSKTETVKSAGPKTDVTKYIVNVQGKDFITFPGLLAEAHAQGLKSINVELINSDFKTPVMKATVVLIQEGIEKSFTGFGDATENNVAKKVAGALIRMCETRAIARALRFACNIDMAAIEELGDDGEVITTKAQSKPVEAKTLAIKAPTIKGGTITVQVAGPDEEGNQVVTEIKTEKVADTTHVAEKRTPPVAANKFDFKRKPATVKAEPNFP